MKTLARTSKVMMFVLVAMLLCAVTAFTACGTDKPQNDPVTGGNEPQDVPQTNDKTVITQYDADLDASITMGAMGKIDFGGSLVETSYVTTENAHRGKYFAKYLCRRRSGKCGD